MKLAASVAAMVLLFAPLALAHPLPKTASPMPNAVLTAGPHEIRIGFSEGLVAAFSGFELDNAAGQSIALGPAALNPNDDKELAAPIKATLLPGKYTVKWHAVGTDTHHVSGHYSFEVKP